MPKIFTSKTQKIGKLGEDIAVKFLMKHGFYIKERNYTKKCGEIDIIAIKDMQLFFVEVKSITNTEKEAIYNPADNLNYYKRKKLSKTIELYLIERRIKLAVPFKIYLLIVKINQEKRTGRVEVVKDIIL